MSDERVARERDRVTARKTLAPIADEFEIHVIGVSYALAWPGNLYELERIQFMAVDMGEPIPVVLVREPTNEHDPNAISVHIPSLGERMAKVGHIPRGLAAKMAPHLDAGERWLGEVAQLRLNHEHPEHPGLQVRVRKVA